MISPCHDEKPAFPIKLQFPTADRPSLTFAASITEACPAVMNRFYQQKVQIMHGLINAAKSKVGTNEGWCYSITAFCFRVNKLVWNKCFNFLWSDIPGTAEWTACSPHLSRESSWIFLVFCLLLFAFCSIPKQLAQRKSETATYREQYSSCVEVNIHVLSKESF